jgi:hypothetical protein
MEIIDEIIKVLTHESSSLIDALMKTKILLHKISHKELVEWVNNEINGYSSGKPLPPYRIIHGRLFGNIWNLAGKVDNQILPTSQLPDEIQKKINYIQIPQSIKVIEEYARNFTSSLKSPLTPDYFGVIQLCIKRDSRITDAWIQTESTQYLNMITEIRSRLLDFILEIQDNLGAIDEDSIEEAAKKIDFQALFQNTVIGDNNTFVIGDSNKTTIKYSVKYKDFDSLSKTLSENGIENHDIDTLQVAIKKDENAVDIENKKFGPEVKKWLSQMMNKAIHASGQIELAIVANLLTNALTAYYF